MALRTAIIDPGIASDLVLSDLDLPVTLSQKDGQRFRIDRGDRIGESVSEAGDRLCLQSRFLVELAGRGGVK